MSNNKIPVAILSDGGDSDELITYFRSGKFIPFIVTGKPGMPPLDYEKHIVRAALIEASERSPLQYCILIKDTSITSFNPSQIELAVGESLISDILYLTRWGDRCDLMNDEMIIELPNNSEIRNVRVFSPKGFQGICISPKLRDLIRSPDFKYDKPIHSLLTELIQNGKLISRAFLPNLFDYDAHKYASETSEFQRLNICGFNDQTGSGKTVTAETYFYITAIIAFFIALGWGMYLLGPSPRERNPTGSPTPIMKKGNSSNLNDDNPLITRYLRKIFR